MQSRIINKGGFSHLGKIWWEVMNYAKCLKREWTGDVPLFFCMSKKENDREINEWYNEEKAGRQIGVMLITPHQSFMGNLLAVRLVQ